MNGHSLFFLFGLLLLVSACGPMDDDLFAMGLSGKGDASTVSVLAHHPIQLYGQGQDAWRRDRLFNRPGCATMAESGCVLTTYAMLNSYFADWSRPDRPRDPAAINTCLSGQNAYRDGCEMIVGGCMEPSMESLGWAPGTFRTLRSEIDKGYPLIARVRRPDREPGECHHSVLVVGYEPPGTSRWSFVIFDPIGDGVIRRLSHYRQVCYTLRFRGPIRDSDVDLVGVVF